MAEPVTVVQHSGGQAVAVPATMPAAVWARLTSTPPARGRLVWQALRGTFLVGLIIGCRRRTAAMLRIACVWINPDEAEGGEVARALVSALEQWSRDNEVRAWRIGSDAQENDVPESFRALAGIPPAAPGAAYSQRPLGDNILAANSAVPIYTQSTNFTCGPACLMMAFARCSSGVAMDRSLELALWRETTTIVSSDGPGGCDPYGLAIAAASRGYRLRMLMSTDNPILIERDDTETNRELMGFVQSEYKRRVLAAGVKVDVRAFAIAELRDAIEKGSTAMVLIDQMETHGRVVPHWILIHAVDGDHFIVNDPWFQPDGLETSADVIDLPIRDSMLERMCWYGETPYRAALIIDK
jgi:predicted double-glycine peptidase